MDEDDAQSRTELDLHANMAVVGKYVFVFESTGKIDVLELTKTGTECFMKVCSSSNKYSGALALLNILNSLILNNVAGLKTLLEMR